MPHKAKTSAVPDEKFLKLCTAAVAEKLESKIKASYDQALEALKTNYKNEMASLRAQIVELQQSQEFICAQYDDITSESEKLKVINEDFKTKNKEQTEELLALKENTNDSKEKINNMAYKLDGTDQYIRRQNLEFVGVFVTENEDIADIVVKLSNLAGANVKKCDISTAHRLPPKRHVKTSTPPVITTRFISRNVRNEVCGKRIAVKKIAENDLPVMGVETKKFFINENLTRDRKQLLWKTKQAAKNLNFAFVWTNNGKIFARKDESSTVVVIQHVNDLSKLS